MLKFPDERINKTEIVCKKNKYPIPIVFVKPEKVTDESSVLIFNGGLNCTNSGNLCLNHPFYNKHWFVSFERSGHGLNKNKPSQFRTRYINELKAVVLWAIGQFPNRKIFLIGESWGSAINLIFYKKFRTLVNGVAVWNMPTKPKDSEKNKGLVVWECGVKTIFTLLTNITTYLPIVQKTMKNITRNPMLLRAMSLQEPKKQNTKLTIAVWRYMISSKRFLLKEARSTKLNYVYIQSGEDALQDYKTMEKIRGISLPEHFVDIPTGYHLLSLEPVECNELYDQIQKFINKGK